VLELSLIDNMKVGVVSYPIKPSPRPK